MATKTKKRVTAKPRAAKKPAASAGKPLVDRRKSDSLRLQAVRPGLTANDLAASLRFYVDGLGFVIGKEFTRDGVRTGVRLKAGTIEFSLAQDDWAKGRDRRKGEGFRLYLSTEQDVDAIAARVKAAGFTLDQEPENLPQYGVRAFMATDPSGFKVTVSKPLS